MQCHIPKMEFGSWEGLSVTDCSSTSLPELGGGILAFSFSPSVQLFVSFDAASRWDTPSIMASKDTLSRVMPVDPFGDLKASVVPEEPAPSGASSMSKVLADSPMNRETRER